MQQRLAGGMDEQSRAEHRIEATMQTLAGPIESRRSQNDDARVLGSERGTTIGEGANTHCVSFLMKDRAEP